MDTCDTTYACRNKQARTFRSSVLLALAYHVNRSLPIQSGNWYPVNDDHSSTWTKWYPGEPIVSSYQYRRCTRLEPSTALWQSHDCPDYNSFACAVTSNGSNVAFVNDAVLLAQRFNDNRCACTCT